jgi:CRISPR-associated protein Cmr5
MSKQTLYRDQERALHAYASVEKAMEADGRARDYRIAVNDLGTNVRRLGLAGALSQIEADARKHRQASTMLLEHLAGAKITGLQGVGGTQLPDRARRLDVVEYMLATRELLQVATWFKRAVQALVPTEEQT